MGATGCKAESVKCTARKEQFSEVDGEDEIGRVCDDPYVHAMVVRKDWAAIPAERSPPKEGDDPMAAMIPHTMQEMFGFNAGVMPGTPDMAWTSELWPVFGDLVQNADRPKLLQETCMNVSAKISEKGATAESILKFKDVLFASLRSLLPKQWNAQHEASWLWFWDRIHKNLRVKLSLNVDLVQKDWKATEERGKQILAERATKEPDPMQIPANFQEMAMFNHAVIYPGKETSQWYLSVFPVMEKLVLSANSPQQFQEECKLAAAAWKDAGATMNLIRDFQATIMSSMRSLNPVAWDVQHEAAWQWFWKSVCTNVEELVA